MELKPLGNTNVMIPEIGLGVWKYSGGVEPLRRGVELGAFLIATAELHGTEDVVGQAVKDLRDRVFPNRTHRHASKKIARRPAGVYLRSRSDLWVRPSRRVRSFGAEMRSLHPELNRRGRTVL